MNREQAVALCRYVKACCPQQAIDEYTPDAWYDLLGDLELDDARQAAAAVGRRQPFCAPAEIRAEVRRLRNGRLENFRYVPVEGDGDLDVYLAATRAQRKAVGDGRREADPARPQLRTRPVRELLAGAFPTPPAEPPKRHDHRTAGDPPPSSHGTDYYANAS